MAVVICPHCSAGNIEGSTFCESCGKALPAAVPLGPRILKGASLAATGVGQKLQSDELRKQLNKASGALLAVAIIQTAFGALMVVMVQNLPAGRQVNLNGLYVTVFGVAVLFWGLWIWSRYNPLPAAIVGLVVYVTLWLLDVVVYTVQASNGPANSNPVTAGGPLSGIVIRIIIIVVLARAIGAGVKYRNLLLCARQPEAAQARFDAIERRLAEETERYRRKRRRGRIVAWSLVIIIFALLGLIIYISATSR